jgi:hypothetical protein
MNLPLCGIVRNPGKDLPSPGRELQKDQLPFWATFCVCVCVCVFVCVLLGFELKALAYQAGALPLVS